MSPSPDEFQRMAEREPERGLVREFCDFLKTNKKWWLVPLLLSIAVLGVLVALVGSPAMPFIYAGS